MILRKIIKIVTIKCQILSLNCNKFDFGWGSAPDPAGGAYSAPSDPLTGFKGLLLRGGRGREGGDGGEGRGREKGKGWRGKGKGDAHTVQGDWRPRLLLQGPLENVNYRRMTESCWIQSLSGFTRCLRGVAFGL